MSDCWGGERSLRPGGRRSRGTCGEAHHSGDRTMFCSSPRAGTSASHLRSASSSRMRPSLDMTRTDGARDVRCLNSARDINIFLQPRRRPYLHHPCACAYTLRFPLLPAHAARAISTLFTARTRGKAALALARTQRPGVPSALRGVWRRRDGRRCRRWACGACRSAHKAWPENGQEGRRDETLANARALRRGREGGRNGRGERREEQVASGWRAH